MVYSAETLALQALPSPRSLVPLYLPFVLEKFGSSADVYIKVSVTILFFNIFFPLVQELFLLLLLLLLLLFLFL